MVAPAATSSRIVPLPEPELTGTVQVVPDPLGAPMDGPATPAVVSAKSAASTPITASLNVTVKLIVAAFVGFGSARTIELIVGADVSLAKSVWASGLAPNEVQAVARPVESTSRYCQW